MSDEIQEPQRSTAGTLYNGFRRLMFIAGLAMIGFVFFSGLRNPPSAPTRGEIAAENARQRQAASHPEVPQESNQAAISPAPNATVPELLERVAQLEAKMKTIETTISAPPAPPQPNPEAQQEKAQLTASVQANNDRLRELEDKITQGETALKDIKTQLADVQEKAEQRLAAMTALSSVREAVQRGESYAAPLVALSAQVKARADAQELLKTLAAYKEGVPALSALQQRFSSLIPQALTPGDRGLSANLHSLIRIRRSGEQQQGADDQSVLARAEAKLSRGEVENTLKELTTLSQPARDSMKSWLENARAYVDARRALDALQLKLTQQEAQQSEPAAAPTSPQSVTP